MKQQRQFPTVTVTKKAQRSLQSGHPWVYGGEVVEVKERRTGSCATSSMKRELIWEPGFIMNSRGSACGLFRRMPTTDLTRRSGAAGSVTVWITAGSSWARISAAAG